MDRVSAHAATRPIDAPARGMPAEHPLPMPMQPLDRFDAGLRLPCRAREQRQIALRRALVLGGAAALTGFAVYEMERVLGLAGLTVLEGLILILFALTFAWIALAFVSGLAGLAAAMTSRARISPGMPEGLTAVLMPTYNEAPARVFAAIEAMAIGVGERGAGHAVDWFVLSDTTDPDIALAEEAALTLLRSRVGDRARTFYRRRRRNIARKSGNIADFCTRWGGGYDYLLVLDADSLMTPETIVELVRRMDGDPDAGLIQTIPRLVSGVTVTARLQQFANRVYGPIVGGGLAWWCGTEGNYWGHNALIRTRAFTEAAGLPDIPGNPPFGGHILSHDFVEAALLRRAGWGVRIAADLGGSYEESPPSLIDLAVRDRRWCQGNLQHTKVLRAAGFHWMSRFHIVNGIMSYLASPLWLLLILAGLALALQAHFTRPEYFPNHFSLFPTWPKIDYERALWLFALTMGVLFGPKIIGLGTFLSNGRDRRAAGGLFEVLWSFVFEVVGSALIAPIMMLVHTGAVFSVLMGRDSGWKPQRRDDGSVPLRDLIHRHRWHMGAGLALLAAGYADSISLVAWLSPTILGLILAIPVSGLTASPAFGRAIMHLGLLRTPEETAPPAVLETMRAHLPRYEAAVLDAPGLARIARDERLRATHNAVTDRPLPRPRGTVDPATALATAKINEARTIDEAVSFLTPSERAAVIATPELIERLGELPAGELRVDHTP